jgi:hypothetical protein
MIQKMKGGGAIMDFLLAHETKLYILYIIAVIVLCIYLYYIFSYKSVTPKSTLNPIPSATPTATPESIKNKILSKIKSNVSEVKNKIKLLDETDVAKSLKGKLDNWGDDIDRLPTELRMNAITCYQNPQGCIF